MPYPAVPGCNRGIPVRQRTFRLPQRTATHPPRETFCASWPSSSFGSNICLDIPTSRLPSSLLQIGKVEFLPAGHIRNLEELMAMLGDCWPACLAGKDVGGLLFVCSERKSRINAHGGSDSLVQRDRPVDGRIQSAAWQTINDDDVAGRLGAECNRPFNLVRIANIDIGIDHDNDLGTLTARNCGQDDVARFSRIALFHRYDDIECGPARRWNCDAGDCWMLGFQ